MVNNKELDNQELLAKYLTELGAPPTCTLFVVGTLWEDRLIMKMFEYIANNPNADYDEIYKVANQIAIENGTLKYYD